MTATPASDKPWGGRFSAPTDAFVEAFTASVTFDQRLALCDIAGSIAHARMLSECGVLTADEFTAIACGLDSVRQDIERDKILTAAEAVEYGLVDQILASRKAAKK